MRVFFALLPDHAARDQLSALAEGLPASAGRRVRYANFHMTLAFIGEIGRLELDRLRVCAKQTQMKPITIRLECLGGSVRSRACWIAPRCGCDIEINALASHLRAVLFTCGVELRQLAFQAHVTLSRSARVVPREHDIKPIKWEARDFALMLSKRTSTGVHYEVLELYPANLSAPLSTRPSVG